MIPGDGVGPDLMKAVKEVFTAAQVPVQFEEIVFSELQGDCSETKMQTVIESIQRNGVGIMGHIQVYWKNIKIPRFEPRLLVL